MGWERWRRGGKRDRGVAWARKGRLAERGDDERLYCAPTVGVREGFEESPASVHPRNHSPCPDDTPDPYFAPRTHDAHHVSDSRPERCRFPHHRTSALVTFHSARV